MVIPFRILDTTTNTYVSQVGGSVFFTAKNNYNDLDADAVISIKQDGTTTQTNILLSTTNTDLPIGKYVYDIKFVDATGAVKTYFKGEMIVDWHVTIRNA
jgi:hypothetical protein